MIARWNPLCCLALLIAAFANVGTADEAARLNVVLFVTDDQSPTAGCYGDPVIQTPHMDRLAAEGSLFTRAYCTTASCSASRSVILSGLFNHATAHYGHMHAYHHFRAYEGTPTLPVMLTKAGYVTARVGKYHVAPESVFQFDQALPGDARNPVQMANNCTKFLDELEGQPFFLYFCTADPHRGGGKRQEVPTGPDRFGNTDEPRRGTENIVYKPEDVTVPHFLPDTPECRDELAEYYQSISRIDQGLGRLLEILTERELLDNTVIIYTSDHGMAFPGGKTTVYEGGLHVPFLVRHPQAQKTGVVNNALISFVDLTPTILDIAGVLEDDGSVSPTIVPPRRGQPHRLHGKSFFSVLEDEDPDYRDAIYASHTFHEITMYYPMRVVRTNDYKLIWNIAHPLPYPFASDLWAASTWQAQLAKGLDAKYGQRTVGEYIQRPEFELYDMRKDPHESHNLADSLEHEATLNTMKGLLKEFQQQTNDPWILKWEYE